MTATAWSNPALTCPYGKVRTAGRYRAEAEDVALKFVVLGYQEEVLR